MSVNVAELSRCFCGGRYLQSVQSAAAVKTGLPFQPVVKKIHKGSWTSNTVLALCTHTRTCTLHVFVVTVTEHEHATGLLE